MLAAGQLADIIIPDYVPFTPLNADTFYGHLLFGLSFARVRTTIARGEVIVEDGQPAASGRGRHSRQLRRTRAANLGEDQLVTCRQ